jgi:hypothetical protein
MMLLGRTPVYGGLELPGGPLIARVPKASEEIVAVRRKLRSGQSVSCVTESMKA